ARAINSLISADNAIAHSGADIGAEPNCAAAGMAIRNLQPLNDGNASSRPYVGARVTVKNKPGEGSSKDRGIAYANKGYTLVRSTEGDWRRKMINSWGKENNATR